MGRRDETSPEAGPSQAALGKTQRFAGCWPASPCGEARDVPSLGYGCCLRTRLWGIHLTERDPLACVRRSRTSTYLPSCCRLVPALPKRRSHYRVYPSLRNTRVSRLALADPSSRSGIRAIMAAATTSSGKRRSPSAGESDRSSPDHRFSPAPSTRSSNKQQIRHRASIACASCRERRIRCVVQEGETECAQCRRTGATCIIKDDDERRRCVSRSSSG